jgi:D-psicose/D-tagatose/L-ribulose 3-epimerase
MRLGCCGSMISPADPIGIGIIDDMARMGFDYIELSLAALAALAETDFAALARRIAQSGIRCEACNNFFPPRVRLTGPEACLTTALEYATGAMDRAARLGVQTIVFGSSGAKNVPAGFDMRAAWRQIVELLQAIGPLAQARSITIAIEPLNRQESNIVNRAAEGLKLAREVNHPHIQLLVDYYHLMMEHESPEVVIRAGDAVRHLHFARVEGRSFPRHADDAMRLFFRLVRQAGYRGRCSIEAYTQNLLADAPRTLQLLRELTGGD